MSVYLTELQFNGTIDATQTSQWVDLTGFQEVRVMVYSNQLYDFEIQWSINNGVDFDYQDQLSAVIDTQRMSLPARARFMRWHATSSIPPQTFRLCIALSI